jgi:hypothetical protein
MVVEGAVLVMVTSLVEWTVAVELTVVVCWFAILDSIVEEIELSDAVVEFDEVVKPVEEEDEEAAVELGDAVEEFDAIVKPEDEEDADEVMELDDALVEFDPTPTQ